MLMDDQHGRGHGSGAMRLRLALIFRAPIARAEPGADANDTGATRLARAVGLTSPTVQAGLAVSHLTRDRMALLRMAEAMHA